MAKKVVFVESPAKAKTIQKFVDKSTVVRATFGHIRDLPKSDLGVDLEHDFAPKYVIPRKASPVVKELKALVKGSEEIYLATDPDREGEAIAWHVCEALGLDSTKVSRILFHEITNEAIQHALEHPGKVNHNLVDAQQARRVLDRLVGYKLSPLLWKKIYRGLSAGRVQSVALRLITDREDEIAAFEPKEYWSLWASFETKQKDHFLAKLEKVKGKSIGKHPAQSVIEEAQAYGKDLQWVITDRITENKQRHPKPPFTTSTLQQEGSRKLHFSAKQTMMHAQKLYEGISLGGETVGLITYMRTDSLNLAETAIADARTVVGQNFGPKYVPAEPRRYKTKSKGAQEAHEAIRPTSFARTPDSVKQYLAPAEYKLYKLIWERAIASQMASADTELTQIHVGPEKEPTAVTYIASGVRIVFPGFLKAYEESRDEGAEVEVGDGEEQLLPLIVKGDSVTLDSLEPKQHFTQPPARFTEASLVKEMERLGIGRPSTYAPTIATIIDRGYVAKEEGKFVSQEVGKIVIELLKDKFPNIVDYDFTAKMENSLDNVADGEAKWQNVIKDFYGPFEKSIELAAKDIGEKSLSEEATDEVCPDCGKPLVIKRGRFGRFYACTGFPDCRHTRPFDVDKKAEAQLIEGRKCPNDGADLVLKSGRYGNFIGCSNYPNCKFIEAINKEMGIKCPKDGGNIIERRSKRGKLFWGCDKYPNCDFVAWDRPMPQPCPKCKGIVVQKKKELACMSCDYRKERDADEEVTEE
ncbi:MAG TPA: type I DNA topoisomerase [Patescibacteria group bacterium]